MNRILIFAIILSNFLFAQIQEGEAIDRILAIVGDQKIMQSEVYGQMARVQQQQYGPTGINFEDDELKENILNSLINEKLMVAKAKEDSIEVLEAEVDARWNQLLEQWKMQYGNLQRVETLFNSSISELRFEYADDIKNQLLAGKLQQTKFGQVNVSPNEVKKFYRDYKDSLDVVADKYKVAHIIRYIKADSEARNKAYEKAMTVRDSLLEGESFENLAKRNSQDPNTATDGGNLGWFDKGRLFPEFEKAAFALQQGETSLPVKTPFGYHIIQTINKKENSINTRHILIKIEDGQDQSEIARNYLQGLRDSIDAGAKFDELALRHSEDESTRGFGGVIGEITIEEMPKSYRNQIESMEIGDISDPIPYNVEEGKPALSIIKFVDFIASHKMNIEKDYEQIESFAKNYKQRTMMQDWMSELRDELYWEIIEE